MRPIIQVNNLSKCYRIGLKQQGYRTLREAIVDCIKAPLRNLQRIRQMTEFNDLDSLQDNGHRENVIWALKDVSFDVHPGEVLGIIGRNGAGKSTLLKVLSRITEPSSGEIKVHGRIASLLEVGTGFHPELTGRENIYLNGTILGMRRAEIDRKFDEIVDFAEIEKFLDTPVKHYSSGMYVRLAFAVAAHLEPEILVIDEVLAVGDAAFQKKCMGKMGDVAQAGRTVLFVSHSMGAVLSLCRTAYWFEQGKLRQVGIPYEVVQQYVGNGTDRISYVSIDNTQRPPRLGSAMQIVGLEWLTPPPFLHGERICMRIHARVISTAHDVSVGVGFSTLGSTRLLTYDTDFQADRRTKIDPAEKITLDLEIESLPLAPGIYSIDVGARSGDSYALDYIPNLMNVEVAPGPRTPGYIVRADAGVRLQGAWTWCLS